MTNIRPEEWSSWTAKGRNYEEIPIIQGVAEFGITFMKWWHQMQPSFRCSKDILPLKIVHDPSKKKVDWSPLKKRGQNGLVVVLFLLAWWGLALPNQSQWDDDSAPAWNQTVDDLLIVLHAMQTPPQPVKTKRGSAEKQHEGFVKR